MVELAIDTGRAARLWAAASEALDAALPLRVRLWDGSSAGPIGAPTVAVNDPRALRRLMWTPTGLGLVRAYVAGEVDVDGPLYDVLAAVDRFAGAKPPRAGLIVDAARLAGLGLRPGIPVEEAPRPAGRRRSLARDSRAVNYHYELGDAFFRHVIGRRMAYSSAVWGGCGERTLEAAQRAKLDLVARSLRLHPGMRVLDVGSGWGAFAVHAALEYGVRVVGVSLSRQQAEWAQAAAERAGVSHLTEFRVQDYREIADGPFHAAVNLEVAEHFGDQYATFAGRIFALLGPGGRLYNQQTTRRVACPKRYEDTFMGRYVYPDGQLVELSSVVGPLDAAGFHIREVVEMTREYPLTLARWERNLLQHREACVRMTSEGRVRAFGAYLAACRLWFDRGRLALHRVLVERPDRR